MAGASFPDETSRLLEDDGPHIGEDQSSVKGQPPIKIWPEVSRLALDALPIAAAFALQNIVQAFSIMMVGRLGPFELSVASYGYMFATCTGTMVAIGGATALDTLCGQAFTSAAAKDNPKVLGLFLQQSFIILSAIYILVIVPIWVFSGHIFMALGWERHFAIETGHFLLALIPGGLFQVIAECLKKFLQVQGESNGVTLIITAASAIAVLANYLLVTLTGLGFYSACLAFTIYQLANVLFLVGLTFYSDSGRQSWNNSIRGLFKGWTRFLFYAVTGILTVATEWWSFQILAMMAARLNEDQIAAQSIIMASDLILTTIPLGLGVAISHRIGKLLGAGSGDGAKVAARAPYILSVAIGAIEFFIIMGVRHGYGYIFTDDKSVVAVTAKILPLMAAFQVLDIANGGAAGILRGAGKTHLAGVCNFVAYYGVGLTSGWYMCFQRGLGLYGLWAGIITGSSVNITLQTVCILFVRWRELAELISAMEG